MPFYAIVLPGSLPFLNPGGTRVISLCSRGNNFGSTLCRTGALGHRARVLVPGMRVKQWEDP